MPLNEEFVKGLSSLMKKSLQELVRKRGNTSLYLLVRLALSESFTR